MQALHSVNPADAAKVPKRHAEHTIAEEDEYAPVAQTPVTADNPVVAQYDPAVHVVQEVDPCEA